MMRAVPRLGAVMAFAAVLAGCGSAPPVRFHTLLPPPADPAPGVAAPAPGWELLAVSVPAQADQPQLVLRREDDTLRLLEQDRWIAPLGEEIRGAVALRLARGAPRAGHWRITLDVQRFDAAPGRQVRVEALWSVQDTAAVAPMARRCVGVFEHPAGADAVSVAAAYRAAVARLGDAVAATLGSAAAGC